MELTGAGWQPANDTERGLRDALHRGDREAYRLVLGSASLVLPVPAEVAARRGPAPWATGEYAGRTYLLAFTSPAAMRAAVGADATAYRESPFADVADAWPDPYAWLAVNLGTPIQVLLDADGVTRTAWVAELAAYPVDAALRAAVRARDEPAYALALLAAEIAVPIRAGAASSELADPLFGWWRTETADGQPVIVAYSSAQRLRADLGADVDHVVVDVPELLAAWPDRTTALAVNPGSPLAGLISGGAIAGIAEWVRRATDEAERAAAAIGERPSMDEMARELAAHQAARDAVARLLRG